MARSRGFLPPLDMLGPFGVPRDPESSGPGKSIKTQHLGTVVGRRGAGISQITGGDQNAHAVNHYGKKGLGGIESGEV